MSCPKNIETKQFLFWKWKQEGAHELRVDWVDLGSEWDTWVYKCKHCGIVKRRHFVEKEETLRLAIRLGQEEELTKECYFWSPKYLVDFPEVE